ncbi:TPA: hypothetical protein DCW38_00185 [candidate division WOR-3 bacterium]|uniref:Uncharacterized protein n=1 Tax=candidate division WOR-3 bacterium TaxID=2052148 RepID=A0A350H7T1_UNCW3|nr:hypothetical protein [candidate division WOR-3 bacterium]
MKKMLFFGALMLLFVSSCSLIGYNSITINIPSEYLSQIDKLVVSIAEGDNVEEQEIEEISEKISFTHWGKIDVIMAYAYNLQGILLFTGKGGDGNLNITLDYAGANAASHVVIFQDGLPWNTTSMEDMLIAEGFTTGEGENQYEFITSDSIPDFELNPYEDLLIIANDQSQTFYNVIGENNDMVNAFVNAGGTILWEVCDNGWAYGDIKTAGIVLPAEVEINLRYESHNKIMQPEHKMFDGITATELYNNYASHEYLTNLPASTNILMNGSDSNEPTLVVYPYGAGIVFMTGQPLEHAYVYQPDSMGLILPRLVKLVLGKM